MSAKLFLLFLIHCCFTAAASPGISEIRELYYRAPFSKESANKFFEVTNALKTEADPLIICYKGAAEVIQAKYYFNPYHKLSYFSKGKQLIEDAFHKCPSNIEIRFIRFCVQTNAPFFLGYNKDINEDKTFILKAWSTINDKDLKERIRSYMKDCNKCTNNEKAILL